MQNKANSPAGCRKLEILNTKSETHGFNGKKLQNKANLVWTQIGVSSLTIR